MSRKHPLASSESLVPRELSPLLIPDAVPTTRDIRAQSPLPGETTAASLPAPKVLEAQDGALASSAPQATVEIAPYPDMAVGDRIDLFWRGDVSGETTAWLPIGSATVGLAVTFSVYPEDIAPNSSAEVSYSVTRAAGAVDDSAALQLRIGEALPLPAPSIDEAVGDQLDPSDVPNGATVRIDVTANLQPGDLLTLHWQGTAGAGTHDLIHPVSSNDVGKDLTLIVPLAVVQANEGESITLSYELERFAGGSEQSPVAVYDVTGEIGSGLLKVMGARSGLDNVACYADTGRRLVALNAQTLAPIEAKWQYEGDNESVTASSFQDRDRTRLLRVSTANDSVRLNVANLCGTRWALAARRNEGNMVAWGDSAKGGTVPSTIATLTDIVEIVATEAAFAARRENGTVVAWGNAANGGDVPIEIASLTDIVRVWGNRPSSDAADTAVVDCAFVALRATGALVAWGNSRVGGTIPSTVASLTDITNVVGGNSAFTAQRANGSVVAWGESSYGGSVPSDIATLTDIVSIVAGVGTFAARRANGTVVAWGDGSSGGSVPAEISTLTDIVEVIPSGFAFAARRSNGTVVAWGIAEKGGSVPPTIATLTDIVQVVATRQSFAAHRANGTVVAWGRDSFGGSVPPTIATLTDIVALNASRDAISALRAGGQVVTWGSADGGDTSSVVDELFNVQAVYASGYAFAALREDGHVVTWGNSSYGGDSSSVADLLNGHVSYEATPVSRGIGRRMP